MGKNLSKDAADGNFEADQPPSKTAAPPAAAAAGTGTSRHAYCVTALQEGELTSAKLQLVHAAESSNGRAGERRAGYSAPEDERTRRLISPLQCDITSETPSRLHLKIYDPTRQRFEVRYEDLRPDFPVFEKKTTSLQYDVDVTANPFAVIVTRKSTGSILFDTHGSQLWFEDDLLQLSTVLPCSNIYGLGERRKRFLIDCSIEHVLPFWCHAADGGSTDGVTDYSNSHGVHPFFIGLEEDGHAYGVFFLNSCPMEVHIRPQSPPTLTYTVGGGIIDIYVFAGPSPIEVVQQYQDVVGRPHLPPYWALGFHLSRWGYASGTKLDHVVQRNRGLGIPYESQWTDVDLRDSQSSCGYKDAQLSKVVEDLHNIGQKYVVVVDPVVGINQDDQAYNCGVDQGIFVKRFGCSWPLVGKAWCGDALFIDFTHPDISEYCMKLAKQLHTAAPFDGIFLERNEPTNLVPGCREDCAMAKDHPRDWPAFIPGKLSGGTLFSNTLCPSARQCRGDHYNVHNLYGHFQLKVMHGVMRELAGKRTLIVSRSTFAGSGKYGGHWTGDNKSSFVDLRYSISEMLDFNLFGIPLVGANVGGFSRECSEELMVRWTQTAAFYPLMRNHNTHPDLCAKDQDPAAYSPAVQGILRDVLRLRYSLLPHLYTLLYDNHISGTPVVRPLFMQYPTDRQTFSIDEQFMWGDSLLVSPCVYQGQEQVDAYFPHDVWYNFFTGVRLARMGTTITLHTPLESTNVHARGGCIIPTQFPAVNTSLSRRNPFGLTVALSSKHTAHGHLYWDDGESLDPVAEESYNLIAFEVKEGKLVSIIEHSGHYTKMMLSVVQVFGVYVMPEEVRANKKPVPFEYSEAAKVLRISGLQLSLLTPLTLEWL